MNTNTKILFFLTMSLSTFVSAHLLSYWIQLPYVQYVNGVVSFFGIPGLLLLAAQFPPEHFSGTSSSVNDENKVRLLSLRNVWNPMIADVYEQKLRAHGINNVLVQDRHLIELNWLYAHATRGAKVVVPEKVADEAERVLSESPRTAPTIQSDRNEDCPNCGSTSIYYHRFNRRTIFLFQALMLGSFAVPIPKRKWVCENCGWTSERSSLKEGG